MIRVMLSGGGTGGHLFPGIALAQRLGDTGKVEPVFITTGRHLESPQLARYQFRAIPLPSPQWTMNPVRLPGFALRFGRAFIRTARIFKEEKPRAVVGLGGYGAVAPCLWASLHGLPVFLLEQNVLPGRATRLLHRFADEVHLEWAASRTYLGSSSKLRVSGNPIRKEIVQVARQDAARFFALSPEKFTLLVMGGSQGAHALNTLMCRAAPLLTPVSRGIQIIHLTGKKDAQDVRQAYSAARLEARTIEFQKEMHYAYGAADLAVGRAGGTSIAELLEFGLPGILVPYPFARDRHQDLNAREMRKAGAALVYDESTLTPEVLANAIVSLVRDPRRLKEMSAATRRLAPPSPAAEVVCERIMARLAR